MSTTDDQASLEPFSDIQLELGPRATIGRCVCLRIGYLILQIPFEEGEDDD
jgi:hypothetical protein